MKPSQRQDQAIELMASGSYGEAIEVCRGIEEGQEQWIYRQLLLSHLLSNDHTGAQQVVTELQDQLGGDREFVALALLASGLGGDSDAASVLEQLQAKEREFKGKRGIAWVRFAIAVLAQERDPELAERALTLALDGIDSERRLGIETLLRSELCQTLLARRDAITSARANDVAQLVELAQVATVELPPKAKSDKEPERLRFKGKAVRLTHDDSELSLIALTRGGDDKTLYAAASYSGLAIIDLASPKKPAVTEVFSFEGSDCRAVTVIGELAYCADYNDGLQLVDLGGKAPTRLGLVPAPYGGQFSWLQPMPGDRLALADQQTVSLYDLTTPRRPRHLWTKHCRGGERSGWLHGLVACGEGHLVTTQGPQGLVVIDIGGEEPSFAAALALQLESKHGQTLAHTNGVFVHEERAYVTSDQGLWIVDLAEPTTPRHVAVIPEVGACRHSPPVLVEGLRAYVCNENAVHVIALDGDAPRWLGKHPLGRTFSWLFDARLEGSLLLGAADSDGLYVATAKPGPG